MCEKIKVLIADDHPIFRRGLKQVIETAGKIKVIGEAHEGDTALQLIEELKPDIVILDVNMPEMSGIDVVKAIREKNIMTGIMFHTMYKEEDLFNAAMDLGVKAHVLKENAVSEIVSAIKSITAGDYYISPSISGFLINRNNRVAELKKEKPGLENLTPKERQILKLIADSKTSKEIADELFVSYRTVENHRSNICSKLDIHGSHALLKFAFENKSRL